MSTLTQIAGYDTLDIQILKNIHQIICANSNKNVLSFSLKVQKFTTACNIINYIQIENVSEF